MNEPKQEPVTLPRENEKPTDELLSRLAKIIEDFTKKLSTLSSP